QPCGTLRWPARPYESSQGPEGYRSESVEMHRCLSREWVFAPMFFTSVMRRIVIHAREHQQVGGRGRRAGARDDAARRARLRRGAEFKRRSAGSAPAELLRAPVPAT